MLRSGGLLALDVMNRVRAWEPSTSQGFSMVGGSPAYIEVTLRDGRQIQKMYSLSDDSPYTRKARRGEACKRKPKDLASYVKNVERYATRQFRVRDLKNLLARGVSRMSQFGLWDTWPTHSPSKTGN